MLCYILTALLFFYIVAVDSAFEDNDDAEYFRVSVSSMLNFLINTSYSVHPPLWESLY